MIYTSDIAYVIKGTTLCLRLGDAVVGPVYSVISNTKIRAHVSQRYADLLDSWVPMADGDRMKLACALAYRGDLLQWNGYVAAWWCAVLELVEAETVKTDNTFTRVRTESRGMPQYLISCLFRLRKSTVGQRHSSSFLTTIVFSAVLLAGLAAGAAEYFAAWVAHRRFGRRLECKGECLVLVYSGEENTTKHVYRWVRSLSPAQYTPYVLGSPLRVLRLRPEWAASSLPTVPEFLQGVVLGLTSAYTYLRVASRSAPVVLWGDWPAWQRIFLAGSRLARQGIHSARLRRCVSLPRMGLFSLQGPEGILLAVELESRGLASVHWLHGILGSRRNLDGLASVAIAMCNMDAAELRRRGHYLRVINGERKDYQQQVLGFTRQPSGGGGDLLLLTTLYHPARVPPNELKRQELRECLDTVSALARRMKCRVVWRPHPHEVKAGCIERMRPHLAADLVTVDHQTALNQQIDSARLIVATVSGTILDVIGRGRVPAVYTGSFFEEVGMTAAIPGSIRFSNLAQGQEVMDYLATSANQQEIFSSIESQLVFDRAYCPPQTPGAIWQGIEASA